MADRDRYKLQEADAERDQMAQQDQQDAERLNRVTEGFADDNPERPNDREDKRNRRRTGLNTPSIAEARVKDIDHDLPYVSKRAALAKAEPDQEEFDTAKSYGRGQRKIRRDYARAAATGRSIQRVYGR